LSPSTSHTENREGKLPDFPDFLLNELRPAITAGHFFLLIRTEAE
jgi:hypothetical protein